MELSFTRAALLVHISFCPALRLEFRLPGARTKSPDQGRSRSDRRKRRRSRQECSALPKGQVVLTKRYIILILRIGDFAGCIIHLRIDRRGYRDPANLLETRTNGCLAIPAFEIPHELCLWRSFRFESWILWSNTPEGYAQVSLALLSHVSANIDHSGQERW